MKQVCRHRFLIVVSILALSLVPVYKPAAQSPADKDDPASARGTIVTIRTPGQILDRRAYDLFCTGLLLESIGDLDAAAQSYKHALEFFPESKEIGLSLASVYYNNRRPDEALGILKKLLPRDSRVYELIAACYRLKGDEHAAFDAYRKVVATDTMNGMAYSFLAGYYQVSGQVDSTIWAFKQLARIQPNNFRVWFEIGRLYALQKDYEGARSAMRQSLAIEDGPENSNTLQALGEIFVANQQQDSAKALYKLGLERDPANIQLHNKIIGIYIQQDSLPLALAHAKYVADANPLDQPASRRLAIIYFVTDSLRLADSIFTHLVQVGDEDPVNFFYLGRIATETKDWDKAKSHFTKLTIVADTSASAWANLGFVYREIGQREKEIETYQTGIRHMRTEAGAISLYFSLGAALEQSGQFDSSVAVFEDLIKHSPDNAQALNYLGYMLADKNVQLDRARDLLTRAISLEPESPAILDSYAWVHFRLGELDTALIYLKQAVELDTDATIFDHLGDVYQAKGNLEQARHWWNRALELQPESAEIRKKLAK